MFESFISGERLRGRRRVCHIKLRARKKKTLLERESGEEKAGIGE